MKPITLMIILAVMLSQEVYSQQENSLRDKIDKIKQSTLNDLSGFQKIETYKDSVSYKYVFIKDKELKLVVLKTVDNNIVKRVSWYYYNGELILSEQTWISDVSNEIINHEKLYTSNGHLVAWIKTDNSEENTLSDNFRFADKELKAYGIKLKEESLK